MRGQLSGSWSSSKWRSGIGVSGRSSGSWSKGFLSSILPAGRLSKSSAPVVSSDMSTGAFGALNCRGSASVQLYNQSASIMIS